MNVNDYNDGNDDNLAAEIEDVKTLAGYRKEHQKVMARRGNVLCTFASVSGVMVELFAFVFMVLAFTAFKNDPNKYNMLLIAGLSMALGLLISIFSAIAKKRRRKHDLYVVPAGEMEYASELEKHNDGDIIHIKSATILTPRVQEKKFVSPLADLEDEEEALSASSEKTIVRNYEFFTLTSDLILKQFLGEAKRQGIDVDKKDAKNFLSHLFYSRFLLVKMDGMVHLNFSNLLQSAFVGSSFFYDCSNVETEDQLTSLSMFGSPFEVAKNDEDKFVFMIFNHVSSSHLASMFSDFLYSIFDKNNRHKVRTQSTGKQYEMSPNLYFILFVDDDGLSSGSSILSYAPILNMRCSIYIGDYPVYDRHEIHISDYRHVLQLVKPTNTLSEKVWRKIDGLEAFVNHIKPYRIENDVINGIENHIAIDMSMNVMEDTLVDEILANDLLPGIFSILKKEQVFNENGLQPYLSDNFESEYSIPMTEEVLKNFNLKDKKKVVDEVQIEPIEKEASVTEEAKPKEFVIDKTIVEDATASEEAKAEPASETEAVASKPEEAEVASGSQKE